MRSAGMLRVRTGTILSLLVFIISNACGLPLQILPSIPGYIPVYIRNGDQPLIEINPALAEAFHETENYSEMVQNLHVSRIPDQQNHESNVEDSKSNDDINKIIDPSPQFVNLYDKDENGKSNIMKIRKVPVRIPEKQKDDIRKLTVAIKKEETSKISREPEEDQFIKVSIVNDPENVQGNLDQSEDSQKIF